MEELIPIIKSDGNVNAVDGRTLHEFLEVKSRFATWITNRIEKYDFIDGVEYQSFSKSLENGGKSKDYILSLDMAKELAMVENNPKGKDARKYFIQVEKESLKLKEEIAKNRERIYQKAEMNRLQIISPEDKDIYKLANMFVNAITCDILNIPKKKKVEMNEDELELRDDVLAKWVDAYSMKDSKSHANMIVRMMYSVKQVGKNKGLNKLLGIEVK